MTQDERALLLGCAHAIASLCYGYDDKQLNALAKALQAKANKIEVDANLVR
jgi:hypothetical protein